MPYAATAARARPAQCAPMLSLQISTPAPAPFVRAGMDCVFHVATAAPTAHNAHNRELMWAVNVEGTRNIIDACMAQAVPRLVYTSSASVSGNRRGREPDKLSILACRLCGRHTCTVAVARLPCLCTATRPRGGAGKPSAAGTHRPPPPPRTGGV